MISYEWHFGIEPRNILGLCGDHRENGNKRFCEVEVSYAETRTFITDHRILLLLEYLLILIVAAFYQQIVVALANKQFNKQLL